MKLRLYGAFTMIELVFVIIVLGILAGIAVPRLAATRDDAEITRAKADISAIKSSIALKRSENLMKGVATFPPLEGSNNNMLFDGVLTTPIVPKGNKNYGWTLKDNNIYTITASGTSVDFTYNATTGVFTCIVGDNAPTGMCKTLIE